MSGWIWLSFAFFCLRFVFWIMQSNPSHVLCLKHRNFSSPRKKKSIHLHHHRGDNVGLSLEAVCPLVHPLAKSSREGSLDPCKSFCETLSWNKDRWYFPFQNGGKNGTLHLVYFSFVHSAPSKLDITHFFWIPSVLSKYETQLRSSPTPVVKIWWFLCRGCFPAGLPQFKTKWKWAKGSLLDNHPPSG